MAAATVLAGQDATTERSPPQVTGIVKRDDGGPVTGARVSLTALAHPELPPSVAWALGASATIALQATTDARGVFRVEVPHRGPFALIAASSDGKHSVHRFPVLAGSHVALSLRPPSIVDGTVLDGRGPATGACVSVGPYSSIGSSRERYGWWYVPMATTADDRGRFRLEIPASEPDLWPVGRSLRASTADLSLHRPSRPYRIDGQSLLGFELRLDRPRRIESRIASASDGRPLAGAEIIDVEETHLVVRTAADGSFSFDNEHGAALLVRAPGHAMQAFLAHDGVCALKPGAVVRARLMTAEGPLAGRRVLLATRDSQEIDCHFAWLTATDGEGRLAVDEARPGEALYGFIDVGGRFVSCLRVVPRAAPIDLGEIHVGPARSLSGTVLAPDGARCAGAMVMLQPIFDPGTRNPPGNTVLPSVLTRVTYADRAGRFRFDCVPPLPQRLAVAAAFDGFRVLRVEPDKDVGIVQIESADTAAGVVRYADGKPAAGASVQYLLGIDGDGATFGSVYLLGQTDGEGRFALRGLPVHESYTVWAMCARDGSGFIGSHSSTAAQNDAIDIVLQPHAGRL